MSKSQKELIDRDAELYGIAFLVDGVRVSPDKVVIKYGAQAGAAPEQEPVAWFRDVADGREYCEKPFTTDWTPLYEHADPSEVERLREERDSFQRVGILAIERADAAERKLGEAAGLLARVINSGALSAEQHEDLEADICAAVDVVDVLKKREFVEHLEEQADKAAALPDYKRECVKAPASAEPAEVKS